MLTVEKIKTDFSHIKSFIGYSEVYHDISIFEGYGGFFDLYIKAQNKEIKQYLVNKFNEFKKYFNYYIPEIENYILNSLKSLELNLKQIISELYYSKKNKNRKQYIYIVFYSK